MKMSRLGGGQSQEELSSRTIPPLCCHPWRQRAIIAVAHTILTIGYHMVQRGNVYQDLGQTT